MNAEQYEFTAIVRGVDASLEQKMCGLSTALITSIKEFELGALIVGSDRRVYEHKYSKTVIVKIKSICSPVNVDSIVSTVHKKIVEDVMTRIKVEDTGSLLPVVVQKVRVK